MDKVVSHIQNHSKNTQSLQPLKDYMKAEEKELVRLKQHIPDALQVLDPVENSLGVLYLRDINLSSTEADARGYRGGLEFLRACTAEQIRLEPKKFVSLCRKLRDQGMLLEDPKRAIAPFIAAISKLEPSPEYITPIHVFVFNMCLLSKCYLAAEPVLSSEACEVDPSKTALTATDFLLYCYYGARIHIGRKKYSQALQLLLQALTAPTMVVNAITMTCYKLYVLVSLIHTGAVPSLPKFTSNTVSRTVKNDFGAYHDLTAAYTGSQSDLDKAVAKAGDTFASDGNMGLLNLALETRTTRAIQKLTQTYLTLSLHHIAENVGLPSAEVAEQHILRMIDSGEIFARVDDEQGMVRFEEDVDAGDSPHLMAKLDQQISLSIKLAEKVKALNFKVSCDKQLLKKMEPSSSQAFEMAQPGF